MFVLLQALGSLGCSPEYTGRISTHGRLFCSILFARGLAGVYSLFHVRRSRPPRALVFCCRPAFEIPYREVTDAQLQNLEVEKG